MLEFDACVESNREQYLSWFTEYLKRPALAGKGEGIEDGAAATVELLERAGISATVWRHDGASPVVYGEVGSGDTTLLIYDHYDVQPAEPLELWHSPPFDPQVRDGKLYARGTSDNRGEVTARVAAVDAWSKTLGDLPLRLKFVIEGEEEIGSPNLAGYVEEHREELADAAGILWEGGGWDEDNRLQFALGGKGLLYVELHVDGPGHDLHSANAAIVDSPAWRLLQALATLRDASGRVTLDGMADLARSVTPDDERLLAEMPMDLERLKASLEVGGFLETDVDALKRLAIFGITCNICGIESGYTGDGPKTVLPSHAWCKLDFRLVPDLKPEQVASLLRAHLDRRGFGDIEIRVLGGIAPSRSDPDSRLARASLAAAGEVFDRPVYLIPMSPGSGPFHLFAEGLGLPLVSAGAAAYEGSRAHAPNENVRLDDWFGDIRFMARLFRAFAAG